MSLAFMGFIGLIWIWKYTTLLSKNPFILP
jgi:hypothetical protein